MSIHEIRARVEHYVAVLIGIAFLFALLAHAQYRDDMDNRDARQCAAGPALPAVQPGA